MYGSTFGTLFRLSTYGESHGPGIGGMVDGCPAGLAVDTAFIQSRLDQRRPGAAGLAGTPRKESDTIQILSGIFEGYSTGCPIGFHIPNEEHRSADYSAIAQCFRPGHADVTYQAKYGLRDYRGGGRSSGRETAARVAGGAIAELLLADLGIHIFACTEELGGIAASGLDIQKAEQTPYWAADATIVPQWDALVTQARAQADSLGGIVRLEAHGVPPGLGEPVFGRLDAVIAAALMSVGAVKGVEIGDGFAAARSRGSANNDPITPVGFTSNHAGGILGGISNGAPVTARVAIKPIPSISQPQQTITIDKQPTIIHIEGRHDACAIPRVLPVLRAMLALALADAVLLQRRMGA